jgi:hypothetical protein
VRRSHWGIHITKPAAQLEYYSSLFADPDRGRILDLMAKDVPKVTFDPKPLKSGSGYYVVAAYPGGQQEHITGFKIEADAIEWLASSRSQAWLKARGYAR